MTAETVPQRLAPTVPSRHRPALALSAGLHLALAVAVLLAPVAIPHDLGNDAFSVELLAEPPKPEPLPPQPEPPQPEPPKPEPPKPEPAKPTPARPQPPRPQPVAAPTAAPATDRATDRATAPLSSQPVQSEPVAEPAAPTAEAAAPAVPVPAPAARRAGRDDYQQMVWARIMRFRPERVPFPGLTRLRFALSADGGLLSVEVAESSGSGLLDRAALDAVRKAAPFPPPPPEAVGDLVFLIPFQFSTAGR